jgi:hypothetical protein
VTRRQRDRVAREIALDTPMRETVSAKLHPKRIQTGGLLTAFLGKMLGQRWTIPVMQTSGITSDGWILGVEGPFAGGPIARVDELERNLRGIAKVAELTDEETEWLVGLIPTAFGQDWRRVN